MNCLNLKQIEAEISTWPGVSVHPHQFGGNEFRFGNAEIGHVHTGGTVDIPFPRAVRDALLAMGRAEEHRWVPDSGWTTFHVRSESDLCHAVELMRVSYLRYALKTASDPHGLLQREGEALHVGPEIISLLKRFVPAAAPEPVTTA